MQGPPSPLRRALALFLAAQPVFWMSDVALAQSLEQQASEAQQAEAQRQLMQLPGDGQRSPGAGASQAGQAPQAPGGTFPAPQPFGTGPAFLWPVHPADQEQTRGERGAGAAQVQRPPPVDEPLDPETYVLGQGDVLELHFWGVENFRLRVAVDLEGRAFVPRVGYLSLGGQTLAQARRIMKESVARFFPKLGFGMSLVELRTFLVQVVDNVVRPGPQPAKATDRVASVIARAGWFGPNASMRRIEIRRRGGGVIRADLLLYTLTGDVKHNPHVLDGDVVRVPFQDLVATVGGAVNRPGKYELVGAADLAELLELAGGLAPSATRGLPVVLVRRGPDDRLAQTLLDFPPDGPLPSAALQRDDSIWIPAVAELQRSITVVGAIAGAGAAATGTAYEETSATRRLAFAQGDTVRSVLERIGGVGPLADLRGAYIVRGGATVPVDLYALVMLRDLTADRPMELGDTLVVPFRRRNVTVDGAVFRPGPYPYNPAYGVEQYLSLAGGMNRFAQGLEDVYVVNPNGERSDFAPGLKIEPGSSVVVPERNFSRSEVVSIILAAAGILLSGAAVLLAARK